MDPKATVNTNPIKEVAAFAGKIVKRNFTKTGKILLHIEASKSKNIWMHLIQQEALPTYVALGVVPVVGMAVNCEPSVNPVTAELDEEWCTLNL